MWARVVLGIGLVAFIAWRWSQNWKAAGEATDAMYQEQQAMRALHMQLLGHPHWHRLWQALAARGYSVSVQGPQPGMFSFGLLSLYGPTGYVFRIDDPSATYLNAYLTGPKKIVASLILATGEVQVRDVGFGEWPTQAF
jgi:hypothetical protein